MGPIQTGEGYKLLSISDNVSSVNVFIKMRVHKDED